MRQVGEGIGWPAGSRRSATPSSYGQLTTVVTGVVPPAGFWSS